MKALAEVTPSTFHHRPATSILCLGLESVRPLTCPHGGSVSPSEQWDRPLSTCGLEAFRVPTQRTAGLRVRGIPQAGANPGALEQGCTRGPLWVASALLRPRPAPQTARDRLLPDGQACSLLPYVTRLCKGSWPAYIRGGRASAQLGRGKLLKGPVSPESPLQGPHTNPHGGTLSTGWFWARHCHLVIVIITAVDVVYD